ncbi:SGNH/GDSL hydrolase family protein [Oxalobacteraceae bacterium A2-2]
MLRSLICGAGLLLALSAGAEEGSRWVASWGTALMQPPAASALRETELRDVTLRQVMRLSLGGPQLRVRISNLLGEQPLVIAAATLGPSAGPGSARLDSGQPLALRFGGAAGVTVPPGEERLSDPLAFSAGAGQDVALSLDFTAIPSRQSVHVAAHATQFVAPGDQSARATLEGGRAVTSWFQVGGIEVLSSALALVAAGDSITDGSGSGKDGNERWTDYLQRRLRDQGQGPLAVINSGIGGNQMLRDDIGQNLLERYERDVLARPGAAHILVLIGVNDLGRLHRGGKETPQSRLELVARLQAGWQQLAERAHARGLCFYAGTITPYGGSTLYRPEPQNEEDRRALNDWLRASPLFDGVADFDAAVRDPDAPDRLQAAFDSGDHLHLSPAGYRAMADAVPLERIRDCKRLAAP